MKFSTEFKVLFWANFCVALFLAYMLMDLISLLIPEPTIYNITQRESEPVTYSASPESNLPVPDRQLLIPKIIHQTYKTEEIPDKWINEQKSCQTKNPDFKYILWTDESAREFIKEHYNWFLPTFDSYPFNIMRADVIRYFVLYHYGGVYIDLDDGCSRELDPLLAFPSWFRKTDPTGISNDIMGSIPKHNFLLKIIDNLKKYNRNWLVSYITIMYSTGPLFVSVMWKQYLRSNVAPGHEVRVLLPENKHTHKTLFFYEVQGSSWHNGDAKLIMIMNHHKVLAVVGCVMLAFFIFFLEYKLIQLMFYAYHRFGPRTITSTRKMDPAVLARKLYTSVLGSKQRPHYSALGSDETYKNKNQNQNQNQLLVMKEEEEDLEHDLESAYADFRHYFEEDEKNTHSRPVSSAFVSTISSIPVVGSIFNWIEHVDGRKPRPIPLLRAYHTSSSSISSSTRALSPTTMSPATMSDFESDGPNSSGQRIPVCFNIASAAVHNKNLNGNPYIFVDDGNDDGREDVDRLLYDKPNPDSDLMSPQKQMINISTVSLSSIGAINDDSASTLSLTPLDSDSNENIGINDNNTNNINSFNNNTNNIQSFNNFNVNVGSDTNTIYNNPTATTTTRSTPPPTSSLYPLIRPTSSGSSSPVPGMINSSSSHALSPPINLFSTTQHQPHILDDHNHGDDDGDNEEEYGDEYDDETSGDDKV